MIEHPKLVQLTADIVAAHICNNATAAEAVAPLIESTYAALAKLGEAVAPEKPAPLANWRRTVRPDGITSLVDGKSYKMLKRHLTLHGFTPESYRAHYGLPADYPMVAPDYAEKRRALAKSIGLGRGNHVRRGGTRHHAH